MISNSVKNGPVKIEKEKDTAGRSRISTANPYRKDNVNVAMGPRMGNEGTPVKRREFTAAKEAREPVATMIEAAYAKRQHEYEDFEYTNGGSIMDNVNEGPRKKRK